jgi:hypothetical protein
MTLKQILLFDINRILRWDVGRFLQSDIIQWRVPALLLRAILGFFVAGIVLAITVPFLWRRGYQLHDWAYLLVVASSVALFTLAGRPRRT